eukprot:gnl/MRDRNA2_/MRDRNA2_24737_c0_seq1.p1 gnl/MRDRNA2_/MRDRNA2_24737_c0~~gnl/MRDRNA2_/MRDRNA2_24737_c0_seq1.p1  ORF type:complete len:168 (+),score=15.94 gnl/MRDRNA2_/MRDRNA2_24737_c0_seq1:3-506(+)
MSGYVEFLSAGISHKIVSALPRRLGKIKSPLAALAVVVLLMGSVLASLESVSLIDGVYFATIALSCVGYGRLDPHASSTLLETFILLIGIVVTDGFISSISSTLHETLVSSKLLDGWMRKLAFSCGVVLVWLLVGVAIFLNLVPHDWSILEAVYFCSATLSTVGYGE